MREPHNITLVAELQPDYMGFIFYAPSPRFVHTLAIESVQHLPETVEKVGVFVNETLEKVVRIAAMYTLRTIQLHGNETPTYCATLQDHGFTVLKAFAIATEEDIHSISLYKNFIDMAVLDTKGKNLGGNGIVFDWNLLESYTVELPFLLSGGISLANIATLLAIKHPNLCGIDVNSKFEIEAGMKDIPALKELFSKVKAT